MTLKMKLIGVAVLAAALLTAQAQAGDEPVLKTQTDRGSYSNGVNIARTLKQQGGEVNLDVLIRGMKDELMSDKLLMTEEDIQNVLAALQTEMARRQKQAAAQHDELKTAADGGAAPKTANAGPGDNSAIKKEEGLAQKTEQGNQITPNKVGTSVVERYEKRSEVKKRAVEMRKRMIEQGRQGQVSPHGAI